MSRGFADISWMKCAGVVNRIIGWNAAVPSNFNQSPCQSGIHCCAVTGGVGHVVAVGVVVCGCAGGVGPHSIVGDNRGGVLRQAGCRCAPRVVGTFRSKVRHSLRPKIRFIPTKNINRAPLFVISFGRNLLIAWKIKKQGTLLKIRSNNKHRIFSATVFFCTLYKTPVKVFCCQFPTINALKHRTFVKLNVQNNCITFDAFDDDDTDNIDWSATL